MSCPACRRGAVSRLALGLSLALSLGPWLTAAASAETFSFSADRVESSMAEGKERTLLSGRAKVRSGSFLIEAEKIEITGKNFNNLLCTGSVVAVDEERGIKIETPRLGYDRARKFSHMEGASVLEDRKNRVVLKAMWIDNDGATDVTVAEVNVRILKADLACRAEYAVYRRKDSSLELTGAPQAFKKGDEYRASRIVVNTETEEISLEGAVQGTIKQAGESEAKSQDPAKPQEGAKPQDPAKPAPDATKPAEATAPAAAGGSKP